MGRKRSGLAKPSGRLERLSGEARGRGEAREVSLTLKHRDAVRLIDAIVEAEREAGRSDVEARVALGGMLRELKEVLAHGEWLKWLASDVPFSRRSAQSYMFLSDWAERHQVVFPQLAPLGLTKLVWLTRVPGPVLAALMKRKWHVVPETGARRTLAGMSVAELALVIRGLKAPEEPGRVAMRRFRRQVRTVARGAHVLSEAEEVDVEEVREIHAVLRETLEALEERFGLG